MNRGNTPIFPARMRDLLASGALAGLGKRLTRRGLMVMLAYSLHANSDGEAWPSVETIAGYWGCSGRTIRTAKAGLIAAGILIDTGHRKGERGAKVYRIALDLTGRRGCRSANELTGRRGCRSANELTGRKQVADRKVLGTQPEDRASAKGMKTEDHTLQPAKTTGRKRDLVWDAVAELFFMGKVAKPHITRVGKLVREFKDLSATADEIRTRLARYRERHPTWTATAEAVVKHWCDLEDDPRADAGAAVVDACHPSTSDAEDEGEVEEYGQTIRSMTPEQRAQHGLPPLEIQQREAAHAV